MKKYFSIMDKQINFLEVINEVIKPEEVDVSTVETHDELTPMLWYNETLKPDIRKLLLKNAKKFIEYCGLEDIKIFDVVLTGSLANYNYTKHSDIDVHICIDYRDVAENVDLVDDFIKTKKRLWMETYPIKIFNHDVEVFFEDRKQTLHPHKSTGVYSIYHDKWVKKPVKQVVDINTKLIQKKASDFMNLIDELDDIENDEKFFKRHDNLKEKLKKYRQSGLEDKGEFSLENIVFKVLRNIGYIEKFFEIKQERITQKLSYKPMN